MSSKDQHVNQQTIFYLGKLIREAFRSDLVMKVRNYQGSDKVRFSQLLLKHYQEIFNEFQASDSFLSDYLDAISRKTISVICVDGTEDGVVGFLVYCEFDHPIYKRSDLVIREIYVAETSRGRSLASKMVEFAKSRRKNLDGKMFVDLQFAGEISDKFWRSAGFLPFQKRYYLND